MIRPRICFVGLGNLPALAPEYQHQGASGEALQHAQLAKALVRRGYRVSMIVGDHGQPEGATWHGVTTHAVREAVEVLPGLKISQTRWMGLWAAARRADADIYYVSCADTQVGELSMFARRYGRKVIFRTAHDDDCLPHRLPSRLEAAGLRYWLHAGLYRHGLAHADAVLVQSEQQKRALKQHFGRDGVVARRLAGTSHRKPGFTERDIDVLWVNNVRPIKRADLAIDLALALGDLQLHMIGGCHSDGGGLYEEVRRRAATAANLVFHGRVSCRETPGLLERARVLANTADSEGFPTSYLQAWARGVPVVTFSDPDGVIAREGLGYTARNLHEMKEAVRRLATDPEAWQQASHRCRAYMAREYGEERVLAPYVATIDSLAPSLAAGAMMAR